MRVGIDWQEIKIFMDQNIGLQEANYPTCLKSLSPRSILEEGPRDKTKEGTIRRIRIIMVLVLVQYIQILSPSRIRKASISTRQPGTNKNYYAVKFRST